MHAFSPALRVCVTGEGISLCVCVCMCGYIYNSISPTLPINDIIKMNLIKNQEGKTN